jgi:ferredoxin-type protein NapF
MAIGGATIRTISNVRPPYTSEQAIRANCTGCTDCISACPEAILVTGRANTPFVDFNLGACSFCGACAKACSEDVFDLGTAPWAHAAAIGQGCFLNLGVTCQSCTDVCGSRALIFDLRVGRLGAIQTNPEACTGCGACLSICPTEAIHLVPKGGVARA